MHSARSASAHLVPVVARHLELGSNGKLDLRQRHEVVEACFARDLLPQEPSHFAERCPGRKPREERIALTRPAALQFLEPRSRRLEGHAGHRPAPERLSHVHVR